MEPHDQNQTPSTFCTNVPYHPYKSELQMANLNGANLEKADLSGANLSKTVLENTNLRGTNFYQAIFSSETSLADADLQGANFQFTKGLTPKLLESTISSNLALYDSAFIRQYGVKLKLPPDHNKKLKNKDFQNYNLQGADLSGADLREMNISRADLTGANLQNADLHGACLDGTIFAGTDLGNTNLKGAKGLTEEQLQSARNYEKAIRPTFPTKDCVDSGKKGESK